jgi:uncharacterized protein YbjT (DUF2867 family)
MTGPQSLGFAEVAAILSDALGRSVTYGPAGLRAYAAHLRGRGMPLAQVAVQTVLHADLRRGRAAEVDPTLARLLGRPGRTVAAYVHDHRDLWAAPASALA